MRRSFLVFLAFLIITAMSIVLIVPYVMGLVIEKKYNQLLLTASQSPELAAVKLTLVHYQRGWFTSEADLAVTITDTNILKLPIQTDHNQTPHSFVIQQRIEHGPVFSVHSSTESTRFLLGQAFITSHSDTSLGKIDSVIWIKANSSLLGSVFSSLLQYNSPTFYIAAPQPSLSAQLSSDTQQLIMRVNIPRLDMKTAEVDQSIMNAQLHYQLEKHNSIQATHHILTIDKITWKKLDSNLPIILNGLSLESKQRQNQQRMDSAISASLKEININNASYGPQSLNININQLDLAALQAVKDQLALVKNTSDLSREALVQYQQKFFSLLAQGIEIQVKQLNLVTPWGSPSLRARITFPPQNIKPTQFADLLPAMDAAVQANIPGVFMMRSLEQIYNMLIYHTSANGGYASTANTDRAAQQQITEWVTKKWLLPKENGYQVNFLYQNKQGILNGEPWSLARSAPSLR